MYESKKWIAVTKDNDGKIQFFYKWIDEEERTSIDNFVHEVKGWNVTILAVYREEDVIMHCTL